MSLNWVTYRFNEATQEPTDEILALADESFLARYNGVAFGLICEVPNRSWTCIRGVLTISNIRIVYQPEPTFDAFKDFSVPLKNFRDTKLNQPWFGANTYTGHVVPVPNGGLPDVSTLTLTFNEGGAFQVSELLRSLFTRLHMVDGDASQVQHLEDLPEYSTRPPSSHRTLPVDANVSGLSR